MANDTKGNPWILDSTGVVYTGWIKVRHVEYVDYVVETNRCVLKDAQDRQTIVLDGASDLQTVRTGNVGWLNGLNVDTLPAGVVRVFFD